MFQRRSLYFYSSSDFYGYFILEITVASQILFLKYTFGSFVGTATLKYLMVLIINSGKAAVMRLMVLEKLMKTQPTRATQLSPHWLRTLLLMNTWKYFAFLRNHYN